HEREGETGVDAPPIDQHGARPALAAVAAFLGPRQAEIVAQRIEQRDAWVNPQRIVCLIDPQAYFDASTERCARDVDGGHGCAFTRVCAATARTAHSWQSPKPGASPNRDRAAVGRARARGRCWVGLPSPQLPI